jgi:hypothetical protein
LISLLFFFQALLAPWPVSAERRLPASFPPRNQLSRPTKPFRGTDETRLKQMERSSVGNEAALLETAQEAQMNHSIHSADRATHMKIVVVALVAGIAVAAFGIAARTNVDYSQTAHVVKAGKSVVLTSSDSAVVR